MTISAALLHPGNRLLSGGTSDFAMFGGQPTAVTIAAPDAGDAGYLTAFSAPEGGSAPAPAIDAAAPSAIYTGAPEPATALLDGGALPLSPLQASAPQLSSPTPLDLAPVGSQALASASLPFDGAALHGDATGSDGTDQAPSAGTVASSPFTAPILDSVAPALGAEAFTLATSLAVPTFAPVLSDVTALTGTVEATALGTVGTATALADSLLATTDDVAAAALALPNDVESAVAPVSDTVSTALADVAALNLPGEIDGVVTPVSATAAGVVADVAATVTTSAAATDTVVEQATAPIGEAQDGVASAVMPLVDHLAETGSVTPAAVTEVLSGSDPAGGIATLTAMVGSADVFEITDGLVPSAPDAVTSTLDDIPADAEAASPLLGDHQEVTHAVGDITHQDDGHIGIAGL